VVLGPDLKILDIDQSVQGPDTTWAQLDVTGFVSFYMNIIQASIVDNPLYQKLVDRP
jgi:hypothetical protein